MSKEVTIPQENKGLHIVPQKKQKIIKMDYGKSSFNPKIDLLPPAGSRRGSSMDLKASCGKSIRHGPRYGNGHS